MDTYMLIMYVTHDQESAIQSLFTDKHWIFCKADPDKLMSSRKTICHFNSLDDAVPTIYTESNLVQKHTTLYGDLHADFPKMINNRIAITDTNAQKIKLNWDSSIPDVELALKVPDVKLKECFVSLKRISYPDTQYKMPEVCQIVDKKRGITKESNISNKTNLTFVKKSETENINAAVAKFKVAVKKRQDIDDKILDAEEAFMKEMRDDKPISKDIDRSCKADAVIETSSSKTAVHLDTHHKSVNDEDETVIRNLDCGDSETQINKSDVESNDITKINETENDDSDLSDAVDNDETIKDPDYGTKLKIKKKTKKQTYTCETCNKTYKFEISYRKHKEKNCGVVKIKMGKVGKKSGHGEYRCATCNKLYTYKRKFLSHFLDGVCMCKCKYCGKVVRQDLKKHIFYKHETKEEKIRCEVCNKRLFDKNDLKDHTLVHSDVKNFVCDQCGKAFSRPLALYVHKKTHEKVSDKPQCDICQRQFNSSSSLLYHCKVTHSNVRNCVCEVCGKRFKTSRCLKNHMRAHSDSRPYQCDICDKSYKYVHQLYAHKRMCHSKLKRFFCSFCNKGFYFRHVLTDHMNIHSGTKVHSCEHCSYTSYTGIQMTQHRRKHRKSKPVVVETVPTC